MKINKFDSAMYSSEDRILAVLERAQTFDSKAAWKEVKAERARERA